MKHTQQNDKDVGRPVESAAELKRRMLAACQDERAALLLVHPFTAQLIMHLPLVVVIDDRLRTAATDGRRIFLDARFMERLSRQNRRFVLAHEVWHCAAGHLRRRVNRDARLWNLACDQEVNSLLCEDGLELPDGAVSLDLEPGTSAEQAYQWLLNCPRWLRERHSSFDLHDLENLPSGDGILDPDFTPQPFEDAVAEQWREYLATLVQSHARLRGSPGRLPAGLSRLLQEQLRPQLSWRELLRQFVQRGQRGSYRWSRPSRRHIHRGLYLPSPSGSRLKILVAIDTSGSTHCEIPAFLAEVRKILASFDQVSLTLVQCDVRITERQDMSEADLARLHDFRVHGMGGTDLRPPFQLAHEGFWDCMVYLTDGFGPAPDHPPPCPFVWVLTEDGQKPSEWGQCIRLQSLYTPGVPRS